MALTQTVKMQTTASGRTIGLAKAYTGGAASVLNESIPDSSTDLQLSLTIDITQIKAIHIQSDQDITLEFNNSTTGVPTIALKANVPFVETTDTYHASLFTADITTLYVTNASGAAAQLDMECVYDPTP